MILYGFFAYGFLLDVSEVFGGCWGKENTPGLSFDQFIKHNNFCAT